MVHQLSSTFLGILRVAVATFPFGASSSSGLAKKSKKPRPGNDSRDSHSTAPRRRRAMALTAGWKLITCSSHDFQNVNWWCKKNQMRSPGSKDIQRVYRKATWVPNMTVFCCQNPHMGYNQYNPATWGEINYGRGHCSWPLYPFV